MMTSTMGDGLLGKRARSIDEDLQNVPTASGILLDPYAFNDHLHSSKRRVQDSGKPNHILLMTVVNPLYPIHVDIVNTLCSPHGAVLRIVIFKKNGVQALVEMDSVKSALRVKDALDGSDIYTGCCTLRIEFAKPSRLNVFKNDAESWDYTNPSLASAAFGMAGLMGGDLSRPAMESGVGAAGLISPADLLSKAGLFPEPFHPTPFPTTFPVLPFGLGALRGQPPLYATGPMAESLAHHLRLPSTAIAAAAAQAAASAAAAAAVGLPATPAVASSAAAELASTAGACLPPAAAHSPLSLELAAGHQLLSAAGLHAPPSTAAAQSCVLMVYGLSPLTANTDRLFNMFCLYGNIVRIKYLKSKDGCAMVQMGDAISVERAISNLNNLQIFGNKVQLGYSKQTFLNNVQQPFTLSDGTLSYKDYTTCKNNRFLTPSTNNKNRIQAPSKVLHFFNTPPQLTLDELSEVFTSSDVHHHLVTISIFPSKTDRSSSGLLEFVSVSAAIEALVLCNHKPIHHTSSKFPFIMKLCFSSSRPGASQGETIRTLTQN